ncbi:hypothetical protein LSH36_1059g02002 [Paralvinella palmiformis]|uniref:EGF-like domain-containing protein n=1 Tax=Paralvinella palmiformis TaxID=53620 RepID=A0AAD9MQG5_9ANNE|nr:hypothetical protein LSH36_1059g02002 [Paralvinella palmiformis]
MTLSGENKTCINVTTNKPAGIALDVENRVIYWTEFSTNGAIKRSSYTGDEKVTVVSNLDRPYGISIDFENNLMYWTQRDIHQCISMPCQNNGTCMDLVNGYNCTCLNGFTGDNCQTAISYCSGIICQNNGVCAADVDGYHCLCMSGFVGDHCETGLGFVIFIIGGIIVMAFGICMSRGASIQRKINKKKDTGSTPAKLFSLEIPEVFLSCAVTRALAEKIAEKQNINIDSKDDFIDLSQTFIDYNENICTEQTFDDSSLDSNGGREKSVETAL